jgi:hypothetical protein
MRSGQSEPGYLRKARIGAHNKEMTMNRETILAEIARLMPRAESGEQWAEICRLEALLYCACGAELLAEQEERNSVCDECL